MLVTQLRAGNLFRDMERGKTRTVTGGVTFHRLYFEPMQGQPDHLDFRIHGPEARQWASKGIPLLGVGGVTEEALATLERSWEHRDTTAADQAAPYPTPRGG